MLELRVLTGTHAGARALLSEEPQWIGSGDDCAVILTDEGLLDQHGCIEHRPDGSLVLRWGDTQEPPVVLRPGESAWVGPVRIAIETLGTAWREDLPVIEPSPLPTLESSPPPETAARRTNGNRWRRMIVALIALALGGGGGMAGWPLLQSALVNEPPPPQPAPRAPDEPLHQLIDRLALKGRVAIDLSDPLRPALKASFLSEQETETLVGELTRRAVPTRLTALDQAEAEAQVVQTVQRVGEAHGVGLTARHLGGGRFRVEGQAADEGQRSQLAADLKDSLRQVTEMELAVSARTELARGLVHELKRQGVGQLQAHWQEGVLQMQVRLPPGGVAQWEQALLEAATKYDVPFRAEIQGHEAVAGSSPTPPPPFRVRSVVTTPQPYVVLADGRRLAPGGEVAGWRLVAVDRQSVRFEGPQGHSFSVER